MRCLSLCALAPRFCCFVTHPFACPKMSWEEFAPRLERAAEGVAAPRDRGHYGRQFVHLSATLVMASKPRDSGALGRFGSTVFRTRLRWRIHEINAGSART